MIFYSLTVATWLTLIRLVVGPLILPFLLVYGFSLQLFFVNIFLGFVFIVLSITDFFDGYLARKYRQESVLGALLDPIADKFLLYSTLISLLVASKLHFFWVLILIGREIFIMGIRSIALEYGFSIPVLYLGKMKTVLQSICLAFIIINPYSFHHFTYAPWWRSLQGMFLVLTSFVSLFSAYKYYLYFITQWRTLPINEKLMKSS